MEGERSRSASLNACVIAGIVGSLIPSGVMSFDLLYGLGFMLWTFVIVLTASGALGGYLGWLIMGKFGVKRFPVIFVVAGIFGFFASIIASLIFLLLRYWF